MEQTTEDGETPIQIVKGTENPNAMPTRVLVGFVNVNQLTRLMDRYSNNELFEKNVRLFLGADKEVNRRIIETVTSDRNSWFGFMNNGVSITADAVAANDLCRGRSAVRLGQTRFAI